MASQGDPRVLAVMNLVLSFAFASVVMSGLSIAGVAPFEWRSVGVLTAILVVVTWLVVLR